jgi:hypothetical protein
LSSWLGVYPFASITLQFNLTLAQSKLGSASVCSASTPFRFKFWVRGDPAAAYAIVLHGLGLLWSELLVLLERYKKEGVNACAFACAYFVGWKIDRHD